jgi:pyruvate dehydrogenase E1 component alpha subunit
LLEMARRILLIRHFELAATALWKKGHVAGGLHTSIGQEGEIVGACLALRTDDYMAGNHRSHGHPIGKGAAPRRLMAELLGKATGVNGGKGGSMHLADFSVGSVGETSIVGSGLPLATGAALGARILGEDKVALCFFGDGASNEGAFHESLNLAAVWKLPVIFLCENNLYGMTTPAADVLSVTDIAVRAVAYDIPGIIVDGQDAVAVYDAVATAVTRARAGEGPSLIEAKTYRFDEHALGLSRKLAYRTPEEVEMWRTQRDPVNVIRTALEAAGVGKEIFDEIEAEVKAVIAEAVEFACDSPFPEPEDAFTHVYAD